MRSTVARASHPFPHWLAVSRLWSRAIIQLSNILRVGLDCFLSRPVSAPAFSAGVIFYVNGLQGSATGAVSCGTAMTSDFQGGLGDSRYLRTSTT